MATDIAHSATFACAQKPKPLTSRETKAGPGGLSGSHTNTIYLPEDWLTGDSHPWHYRLAPNAGSPAVPVRPPTPEESRVIAKGQAWMQKIESRGMVLIADGAMVEAIVLGLERENDYHHSTSVAPTPCK